MATADKNGSWAEHGRVLPGHRTKPKVIDQILTDGRVVQLGEDQTFSPQMMQDLLRGCFEDICLKNGHFHLSAQGLNGKNVCFYVRNISHLGGDWGSEKKRIQIGSDFPAFYNENKRAGEETILLGVYHYYQNNAGVVLFVCFSSETYATRATHNSAAHIHTIDLIRAQKNGVYRRIDRCGNELLVLNKENFIRHINAIRGAQEISAVQKDRELLRYLDKMFDSMPRRFVGIDCYKEMMSADDKSRMNQSAWEGWYYEFYVQRYLREHPTQDVIWWSKKEQGELDFDLKFPYREWFYGDVKSDDVRKDVQGNLKESIDFLVKEKNGRLWYVAIAFTPEKDADHGYETTKWWNRQLDKFDKPLSYCKRMKYAIDIKRMDIYEISVDTIPYLKEYRPSPCGKIQRKPKYKIPSKMKEFLRIYERV